MSGKLVRRARRYNLLMDRVPAGKGNNASERRSGADRRGPGRRTQTSEKLLLLLAKLLSLLLGALIGFFVAYIISLVFASDFKRMISEADSKLRTAQEAVVELSPSYEQANQEYQQLREQLYPGSLESELRGAANAEAGAAAVPPTETSINAQDADSLNQLKSRRDRLKAQLDTARGNVQFWSNELGSYRRTLLTLDYLSVAVVLLMTALSYALYQLMFRLLKRASTQWEQFSLGPEPRSAQAIVGFLGGVIVSVILLLAIFNSFGGQYSILANPAFRLLFGSFMVGILGMAGALTGIAYFTPPARDLDPYEEYRTLEAPRIMDTSVIIDGRVHEVAATGFLGGTLIVTNSVLRELQSMADSNDERKRSKGRRGLELVRKLQEDPRLAVMIFDDSRFDSQAHNTDEQLILVAAAMNGVVATNDYNLNRVAAIRDVRVININALANAVKTNLLPGDYLEINIVDRGKQKGQGVGYLEDGTMVVVEDGEPHIKHSRLIKITSVTQTVQGRLIFGRVDAAEEEGVGNSNGG